MIFIYLEVNLFICYCSHNMENKIDSDNASNNDELFVIEIMKNLSLNCSSSHSECNKIQKIILKNIHDGKYYPAKVLEGYIKFLTKSNYGSYYSYDYYGSKKCIVKSENYIQALSALIAFHCPTSSSINLLIDANMVNIINIIIDNGYELPRSSLDYAISSGKPDIADILSKYDKLEVTAYQLEAASAKNIKKTIMNILTRKISPTSNSIVNAIKHKNIDLVKTMLNLGGFKVDSSLLVAACESKDYEMIKLFLDLKIIPTSICFKKIVSNEDISGYGYRRSRYLGKTNKYNDISKLVDLLINYGYKPTYDDIVVATRNHIKINNIELYDIKLDEKFLEVCAEYNYYPYQLKDINPTTKCLEKACTKSGNLTAIKDLVKNNVKPNTQCLREACKHKNNLQTIKFLIQHGAKPDLECIENISNVLGNRSLLFIINEYKKTGNIKKDNEDKKDDKYIVISDDDLDEPDEGNVNEIKIENDDELEGVVNINDDSDDENKGSSDDGPNEESNSDDDGDDENKGNSDDQVDENKGYSGNEPDQNKKGIKEGKEYIKGSTPIKNKKGKNDKILVKGKKNKDSKKKNEVEEIEDEIEDGAEVGIPENKIEIITVVKLNKEIDIKETFALNDNLSIFLTKKKGSKMTYLEVKQKILEYAKDNNLFDKNNKLLIKINQDINKISGYKINAYMNFIDFDNFIANCISK